MKESGVEEESNQDDKQHFEEQTLVLTCDIGIGAHIPNYVDDGAEWKLWKWQCKGPTL